MQVEDLYVQSIVQLTLITNAIAHPRTRQHFEVINEQLTPIVFDVYVMYRLNRPSHRQCRVGPNADVLIVAD